MIDHRIWTIERTREDPGTSFESLSDAIAEFAVDRDLTKFHTLPNLLIALMGEVGEVAELVQWRSPEELAATLSNEDGRTRLSEELADVLIYLVRMAQGAGIDLLQAAERKLSINAARYPIEASKGNAVKYSDRKA